MSVLRARAQLGNAAKAARRHPESATAAQRVADARRDLARAKVDQYIRVLVESAPKLSQAQKDALAVLLRSKP